MTYKCPRCGYTTIQRGDIKKHFKRKKVCSASCSDISIQECYIQILGNEITNSLKNPENSLKNPENSLKNPENSLKTLKNPENSLKKPEIIKEEKCFICNFCNRGFTRKDNLRVHISDYCREKNTYSKEMTELRHLLANKEALLQEKDKIMDELKKQIETLLTKVGNTTNNTININIRAFGKENLDYIKGGFIKELINRGPYSAIPKLLKEIHFNPRHKENNNVKILNRKEKYAKRYNGERWEFADKNLTLEDMSDKAFNVLTEYGIGKKFDKFYNDYDDRESGLLKKMKSETEMMILNNQSNE